MIRRTFSTLPTFKAMEFHSGLNIVLSEKSKEATLRHTRNRAGKTSLIELFHFLLGANCSTDCLFRHDALRGERFGMEFDLDGKNIVVERSGTSPTNVLLPVADTLLWPKKPAKDKSTGEWYLSNTHWKTVLAQMIFGLRGDDDELNTKFTPTFRSLLAYFIRRQSANGFIEPVRQSEEQQTWDQQVAITYLIGLDWTIPQAWQQVRQRERALDNLRAAAKQGLLGDSIGTAAALRTQLTSAEEAVRRMRENVQQFRVLHEYHSFEVEASEITGQLNAIADANTSDRQLLKELLDALDNEKASLPVLDDLARLYSEAGLVLPDAVKQRYEDVQKFHKSVIQNRRTSLQNEISEIRLRLVRRDEEKRNLDLRKAQLMSILQAHGALENYTALQSELSRLEARADFLRERYKSAEAWESQSKLLEAERSSLAIRLLQNFREEEETLRRAILAFEDISNLLYGKQCGSLTISETADGPEFKTEIQGATSRGINNMQIFCFDMMLMQLSIEQKRGPGFLIHDSHLFDGVDNRQIGNALKVGAELADKFGFQYIVTMNSDDMPTECPDGFCVDNYILPITLTDATENGGLFGKRF